jgi:phosphatidate cytidylyltransferase
MTVFGVVYVGLLGSYLVQIHLPEHGAKLEMYFVAVAKAADIGGYLTGKLLGKRKLAPTISPKKTIEGSAGGIGLSLIVAFSLSFLLPPDPSFSAGWKVLFAVLVNFASQFGDLAESMVKRSCDVKDSAVFLPKVCGALDLIDSVLISAPVAFYLIAAVTDKTG